MAGACMKGQRKNTRYATASAALLLVLVASLVVLLAPSAGAALALDQLPASQLGPEPPSLGNTNPGGNEPVTGNSTIVPNHYIVVLKDSIAHPGLVAKAQTEQHDGELGLVYRLGIKGYSAELSKEGVRELRSNPRVKYIVPDREYELESQTVPSGIQRIFDTENETTQIDGEDQRVNADVAVIDTGIDETHPDLNVYQRTDCSHYVLDAENKWRAEPCEDGKGTDEYGHGTHVAGTIGALDNGEGAVGAAPGARLWSVRVFNEEGLALESGIINGVEWVTAHADEIEVANMSLGGPGDAPPLEEAIETSIEAGVVYVVAAGNGAEDAANSNPSRIPDVITVSALADYDGIPGGKGEPLATRGGTYCTQPAEMELEHNGPDDTLADFSNYGKVVDVAAPGVCIYSTLPMESSHSYFGTEYGYLSGTSMASPHVAGAAAVLASEANPEDKEDVEAIRNQIVDTGNLNWDDTSGDEISEPLLDMGPTIETSVMTGDASVDDEAGTAVLHGTVQPGELKTEYYFEYGPTTKYGTTTPASPGTIEAGPGYTQVSETIGGLINRNYHYRLVATNSSGTHYGFDHAFYLPQWTASVGSKAGSPGAELRDVSCLSADECLGITEKNRAAHWDGENWTDEALPEAPGEDFLRTQAISCSSSTMCMAVGWFFVESTPSGGAFGIGAVRWDGTKWHFEEMPLPEDADPGYASSTFGDVSCKSATFCVAVGNYTKAESEEGPYEERRTLAERWDGSEWTVQPTPTLSSPNPEHNFNDLHLRSVSCVSSAACMAVGSTEVGYEGGRFDAPLTLSWDGSSWEVPQGPGFDHLREGYVSGELFGVSCPTAARCVTVGQWIRPYATSNVKYFGGLQAVWDGTQWKAVESTSEPITGVACAAANWCVAATRGYGSEFGEHWDGTGWTPQMRTRNPGHTRWRGDPICLTTTECIAFGRDTIEKQKYPTTETLELSWPAATTEAATDLRAEEATLNATVNPSGSATEYRFEWGAEEEFEASGYGNWTSEESIGSGVEGVNVSQKLEGLEPGVTYHFRVVAYNEIGTTYGEDETFTMPLPTTLCEAGEAESLCPEESRYPAETAISGELSSKFTITSSLLNVECGTSKLKATTESESSSPLALDVEELTFSNCGSCTVTSENLGSGAGSLSWIEGADGKLESGAQEEGSPRIHFNCSGLNCRYYLPALTLKGGNPAQLSAKEQTLIKQGGLFCPPSGNTTLKAATYTVASPKPLYVARVG